MEGKSGHLKLTISFTNNYSQVKNINGKSIVIHPSYLAGGMLNMSTGKFSNVKCESGKIVNDGTNEMLAFANIPGLNETLRSAGLDKVNNQLGISDDVTVEADVNDFDLGSIMVGMTNEIDLASELGEIGSVSELTDGIDQLIEADDQLIDGSKQLYDGTTQLKEQAAPLTGSSDQVRQLSSGAIQLNDGVKALQTGITQYTAGASAINEGVNQLYGIPQNVGLIQSAVTTSTEEQASLVDGSQAVADGLGQLLDKLNGANVTASVKEMNGLLTKSKTDLEGMAKTLGEDKRTLEGMQTDLTNASTKLTPLKDKLDTLGTEIVTKETQNNTAIADYNSKKKTVNDKITAIKNSMNTEIETSITTLSTAKQALNDAGKTDEANSIQTQIDALNKEKTNVDAISTIEGLSELQTLTEEFNTLNETLGTVKSTISDMSTLVGKSISVLEGLATDVQAALTTIDTLSQILSGSTEKVEGMQTMLNSLKPGVTELYNGALKINAGAINLGNKLGELQTASQSGVDKIKAGTTQLTSNNATLNGGASALSEATGTLAGQSGTFNEMADGLDTLGKAFETLNSGAKQLYEGNEQFKSEGLDQLKEKVDLGVGELETLQSVMDEIKAMNKEYASYSGAPEGATVTSRYVFRTKEESSK